MPLVPAADIDSILFVSPVTGTADATWAASAANVPGHRVPPAALNGLSVGYKITHTLAGVDEFENGTGVLNTTLRTLTRTDSGVTARSSGGAGTRHNFSPGAKHIAITVLGRGLGQLLIPTPVKNSAYQAFSGDLVLTDTTGGTFAVTLPASPTLGMTVKFLDITNSWGTNALTVLRNGALIEGLAEDVSAVDGRQFALIYSGTSWRFSYQDMVSIPGGIGSGTVNLDGQPLVNYSAPHVVNVSGPLAQSAHGGRICLITGTVTVPVTDGFFSLLRNKSGLTRTVQPVSGLMIHEGTQVASINLPHLREIAVHGDGTQVWAAGALS